MTHQGFSHVYPLALPLIFVATMCLVQICYKTCRWFLAKGKRLRGKT